MDIIFWVDYFLHILIKRAEAKAAEKKIFELEGAPKKPFCWSCCEFSLCRTTSCKERPLRKTVRKRNEKGFCDIIFGHTFLQWSFRPIQFIEQQARKGLS